MGDLGGFERMIQWMHESVARCVKEAYIDSLSSISICRDGDYWFSRRDW